jgi:hypothetical protein
MDSRMLLGNGSTNQDHYLNVNITITERIEILETKELMRVFMVSHLMIRASYHNHGEEPRTHMQSTDLKIPLGNG